jgi:hypothetical protein
MHLRGMWHIYGLLVCGLCAIHKADGEHSHILGLQISDIKQPYLRLRGGGNVLSCFMGKQREAATTTCSMPLTVHYLANQTDTRSYAVAVAGSGGPLGVWDLSKAILMNDCGGGRYLLLCCIFDGDSFHYQDDFTSHSFLVVCAGGLSLSRK